MVLKPQGNEGKLGQTIVYSMKDGTVRDMKMEAIEDEWSSDDSSSTMESSSSSDSSEMRVRALWRLWASPWVILVIMNRVQRSV